VEDVLQRVVELHDVRFEEQHPLGVDAPQVGLDAAVPDLLGELVKADVLLEVDRDEIRNVPAAQHGRGGSGDCRRPEKRE
jgi:hypothetical protein